MTKMQAFNAGQIPAPLGIGTLGIISHSWYAGSSLSTVGTPQFEREAAVGRLAGRLGISNENIYHLGVAGSYVARHVSGFNAPLAGWASVFSLVYPGYNPNYSDVGILNPERTEPAVGTPNAWLIGHGINDLAVYAANRTNINHTQSVNAWKLGLRAILSRLRAGTLYCSYLNSSGTITWDSSIAFGGSGSWVNTASTGNNSGPGYAANATNGGTVTITIPSNFTGGTVAVAFLAQPWAWAQLNTTMTTGTTSINLTPSAYATCDFPASGNYIIQIDSEQMLVTGGQGTATLTVTRAFNGTSLATHSIGADLYMASQGTVTFTGTASAASGTISLGSQGLGSGGSTFTVNTNLSNLPIIKRFTLTSADAGKTIICTTSANVASDTYTTFIFDSWWIEANVVPLITLGNLPRYPYGASSGYGNLIQSDYTDLNSATTSVVGEFDSSVQIADLDTPFYARGCFPQSSMNATDVTTTLNVTANNVSTFTSLGVGWVITCDGEDMLVTANSFTSGSTFSITVTRGYNSTTKATHATTRLMSDATWMHTDNLHPSSYGHAVIADAYYTALKKMVALKPYQLSLNSGNTTQDTEKFTLGIKDGWYMEFNINAAKSQSQTFTLNKLWYWPFFIPQPCIMIGAAIVTGTTTAGTATNVRMGLYDVLGDRYMPGGLIAELGTSATTATTSVREVTCYRVLKPGWYFLGYVNQGTTAGTVTTLGANGYTPTTPFHMVSSVPTGTSMTAYYSDQTTVSGALPNLATGQMDSGPCPVPYIHLRAKHYS